MKVVLQQQLHQERKKFSNYLDRAGLKLSRARAAVFDEAMKSHGHFAAEELVKQCRENHRHVSRATIYRSLRELLATGVIRETAFGEKHQHYEHVYDEKLHHHARCIRCNGVIEFPCRREDNPYLGALEKKGFQVLGHEMHFYGICRECWRKRNGV